MLNSQNDPEGSSIMDTYNSFLERLPVELLLDITDYLDDTSKTCLKFTSRGFRSIIRIDVANMDICTRWLIMTRLEEDAMLNAQQWKNVKTMACALCKMKRNVVDFTGEARKIRSYGRKSRGPEYDSLSSSLQNHNPVTKQRCSNRRLT